MKKVICLVLSLFLVLSSFAACSNKIENVDNSSTTNSTTKNTETPKKEELVIMSVMANESFDPFGNAAMDATCIFAVYDTLVKPLDGTSYKPGIAESWEDVDNGMAIVFKIRDNATFHDGTPVTGEDVYFSWTTMLASPLGGYLMRSLSNVELISPNEIKITKVAPYVNLLEMATIYGPVVSKAAYEKDKDVFAKSPVGSGPYKFVEFAQDRSAIFEANENYWDGSPDFKNLIVRTPIDNATALIGLENKEIDLMSYIPNSQLSILEGNKNITVQPIELINSKSIIIMPGKMFTEDIELRKAIYNAANVENMMVLAAEGNGIDNNELAPDLCLGEYKGYVNSLPGRNIDAAKEALAKSKYDGSTIKISITANDAILAQSLQSDLSAIGINTEIEQLEMNDFYGRLSKGEIDFSFFTIGSDPNSYESVLALFTSQGNKSGRQGSTKPEWDTWFEEIKTTSDKEVRKTLVKQLSDDIVESYNIVPLFSNVSYFAYNSELTYGITVKADRVHEIKLK